MNSPKPENQNDMKTPDLQTRLTWASHFVMTEAGAEVSTVEVCKGCRKASLGSRWEVVKMSREDLIARGFKEFGKNIGRISTDPETGVRVCPECHGNRSHSPEDKVALPASMVFPDLYQETTEALKLGLAAAEALYELNPSDAALDPVMVIRGAMHRVKMEGIACRK